MAELTFTSPRANNPGTIAAILKTCYADLVASDPDLWGNEAKSWEWFDTEVYDDPEGVGTCTFLSWCGGDLVGFASFDPRQWPSIGIIGHNGILPEFQGQGYGKRQIEEILRRFR